jgi:hypothetical protein
MWRHIHELKGITGLRVLFSGVIAFIGFADVVGGSRKLGRVGRALAVPLQEGIRILLGNVII